MQIKNPSLNNNFYRALLFILTLLTGIAVMFPWLNFQGLLAQGDHGRDLYVFQQIFLGNEPYKDLWWQYGPLMPYYYSLFFKLFGVSIQSVLLGKVILILLTGLLIYATTSQFTLPIIAYLAAFWFFAFRPDFFYTYNHTGGLPCVVFIVYCLAKYIYNPKKIFICAGSASIIILSLIRLNIGVSTAAVFFISLYLITKENSSIKEENLKVIKVVALLITFLVVGVYAYFLNGLSFSNIMKCLPYSSNYLYDNSFFWEPVTNFLKLVWITINLFWYTKVVGFLLVLLTIRTFFLLSRYNKNFAVVKELRYYFWILFLLIIFNSHEIILSNSIYRFIWVFPTYILMGAIICQISLNKLPKITCVLICILLVSVSFHEINHSHQAIRFFKKPENLFKYGQNKVYIANYLFWRQRFDKIPTYATAQNWIETVTDTSNFLKRNLDKNDFLLAIPYDAIYYYLIGNKSIAYPTAFFSYINITSEEERQIITSMKREKVNYVIISNRAYSLEKHLGHFGVDYCPLLAEYINNHYEVVATFGDWKNPAGFTSNHGVKIYKKRQKGKG